LTVNGKRVEAAVAPRMHLADFLREDLHLTGTHLGCEHGVCGACTLLVDGALARGCITFAAMCGGADVITIEGLAEDTVMVALRAAFSAEHALQCGYCTPGMLVTARDIVRRLPEADDERIRLELAGNLCRCTGYNGIVKAIRRVLDLRMNFDVEESASFFEKKEAKKLLIDWDLGVSTGAVSPVKSLAGGTQLTQTLRIGVSADALWAALQDPKLVAQCVPGASLTGVEGTHITGEISVSLGPIRGRFVGSADVTYGERRGRIQGDGRDMMSRTRLAAQAEFSVMADGETALLVLDVSYSLRGPLAQFARGPVVQAFADEMTGMVAKNLAARLRGEALAAPKRLSGVRLLRQVIWRRLKTIFGG
jgi:carbon-monoxide dehydrogenase small subunit